MPNTREGLDNRGGGGNPSKKLINGGVSINGGGSEIRKKRGFTLTKRTFSSTVFERNI